ncbi:LOW QUALITY PROTEIN: hypothetical protein PanWU01x14_259400 [Parasponia andersonii]|uniref:Uncharacterized protein n=1 Tax=Parasponia andersonii TaxID=3476 RepID=A0A2P5B9C0_PARAD|nr:LOW QUALITY PROTEIN: hypothetical protein PanWU01x14_259400 [Parasponia andersonii]
MHFDSHPHIDLPLLQTPRLLKPDKIPKVSSNNPLPLLLPLLHHFRHLSSHYHLTKTFPKPTTTHLWSFHTRERERERETKR